MSLNNYEDTGPRFLLQLWYGVSHIDLKTKLVMVQAPTTRI